jgi:hypothetical protein
VASFCVGLVLIAAGITRWLWRRRHDQKDRVEDEITCLSLEMWRVDLFTTSGEFQFMGFYVHETYEDACSAAREMGLMPLRRRKT